MSEPGQACLLLGDMPGVSSNLGFYKVLYSHDKDTSCRRSDCKSNRYKLSLLQGSHRLSQHDAKYARGI
jgi:hypothetical protein